MTYVFMGRAVLIDEVEPCEKHAEVLAAHYINGPQLNGIELEAFNREHGEAIFQRACEEYEASLYDRAKDLWKYGP